MKLQTTRASDKAAHTEVSVKEKVSREMSISAQREERLKEGENVSETCGKKKKTGERKTESIKERSNNQNMRGGGKQRKQNE